MTQKDWEQFMQRSSTKKEYKWQFLNSYKDNVLEADTAGEYLLTTQNLRFAHVDMTFFIAGLVVIVGIIIAYIVIKKRYWFW